MVERHARDPQRDISRLATHKLVQKEQLNSVFNNVKISALITKISMTVRSFSMLRKLI